MDLMVRLVAVDARADELRARIQEDGFELVQAEAQADHLRSRIVDERLVEPQPRKSTPGPKPTGQRTSKRSEPGMPRSARREHEAAEHSKELDQLIADLGYGTVDAVQEYVSIVLSHSAYPEHFPVSHEFSFSPEAGELQLKVVVPGPEKVPAIKAYKFTKASDAVTSTSLPQKESKERYVHAVHQVTLRSLHEVFEADRRGLIQTISLELGTKTTDRATGQEIYVPFVAVGAERESFLSFDLSAVVPTATLARLGAAVSKDPYNLVPADTSGVRRL